MGHLLARDLGSGGAPAAVLVGFPTDQGVRLNGGRPGAAQGPSAIRTALYRLTPDARDPRLERLLRRTGDLGDLRCTRELAADQAALGAALPPHLARGSFVIVPGGGHETSYEHYLGSRPAAR